MDHYETLGVSRDADAETIKKAYRKKAAETHPDREGGSKEHFQEVQRAGEVLMDPELKERYDRTGGDSKKRDSDVAETMLMEVFNGLICKPDFTGDFVVGARETLMHAKREMETQLVTSRREMNRCEKLLRRVVCNADRTNFFENLVQRRVDTAKSQVNAAEKTIEAIGSALELLSIYSDTGIPPQRQYTALEVALIQHQQRQWSAQWNITGGF